MNKSLKKYLLVGACAVFFSHDAMAQNYNQGYSKGNDSAQMMQDTTYARENDAQAQVIPAPTEVQPQAGGSYNRRDERKDINPGFYIGGYGGYGWTNTDLDGAPDADVNGMDYGLMAGMELEALLNGWMGLVGAIEGFYGWSEAEDEVNVAGGTIDVEKDHEWGINFRPGLTFFNDHMPLDLKPYGIIGYRNAQFETSGAGGSSDENFDGFELGIGSEIVAYDNVGIRLDYSHVFYGEENGIDLDENDLRLGVAYHF